MKFVFLARRAARLRWGDGPPVGIRPAERHGLGQAPPMPAGRPSHAGKPAALLDTAVVREVGPRAPPHEGRNSGMTRSANSRRLRMAFS
jgi:hypothetical protein